MLTQPASLTERSVLPFFKSLYTDVLNPKEAACFASLG